MTGPPSRMVSVDGAQLEVEVRGSGEPVVLVRTALLADELLPLACQPALSRQARSWPTPRRPTGRSDLMSRIPRR